jgi:hypothetical protein
MGDGMQWEAERPLRCPGDPPKLTINGEAFTGPIGPIVALRKLGTHYGQRRFVWGCWSGQEFESMPGSLASRPNPEETTEAPVMKSTR